MIKNLLITYLFLITNVFAGLPPTTVKGQAETVKTTTFNVEVPYSQATTTAAGTRLVETGNENVLKDPNLEGNSIQWSTYADAAGTAPVDGTGGTPNITVAYTTSSPLDGVQSLLLTKDAVNRQGQGISIPFTIPDVNKGKVNRVKFAYEVVSGTYATGDLSVWIINTTTGRVIQPSGTQIENSGLKEYKENIDFQSDIDSNTYRLVIHVTSTSASAYSLKFDKFALGLLPKTYGSAVTDWISYTPTFTGFTTTSQECFYKRSGGDVLLQCRMFIGSTSATNFRVSLPTGFSISNTLTFTHIVGKLSQNSVNSANQDFNILALGGLTYVTLGEQSSNSGLTSVNATVLANVATSFFARIPIQGWSSSQQLSEDADTRVIAASVYGTPAAYGANAPIIFPSVARDTHGAYNPSTGRYLVPVSGWYQVTAFTQSNNYPYETYVSRNGGGVVGPDYSNIAHSPNSVITKVSGAAIIFANAGDFLDIRQSTSSGTTGVGNVSFSRVSGPSQIAASETVSAYYTGAPPTGSLGAADNIVTFGTKVKDTHNAYSSGSYTVPVSGTYAIQASITFTGTWTVGQSAYSQIFVNGTVKSNQSIFAKNAGAFRVNPNVTVLSLPLLAGDVVTIRSYAQGSSLSYIADGATNFFSIVRTGNY